MSIAGIPPINPFAAIGGSTAMPSPSGAGTTGGGFAESLTNVLDALQGTHNEVDQLAVQAATGDLTAVHDFTIAAAEAQMMTQLTVEVRNRAVEAFNDIMRMQV